MAPAGGVPTWMLYDPIYSRWVASQQAQQSPRGIAPTSPQPTTAQQVGGTVGELGGMYAGSQLLGGGAEAAAVSSGATSVGALPGAASTGMAAGSTVNPLSSGVLPESLDLYGTIPETTYGPGAGLMGGVGPGGILAGAATGALQASGAVKTFDGDKKLNAAEQAALFLPTFGGSLLINPAKKLFGSGKGKAQRERDSIRSKAVEAGMFDKDFNLRFSDGSSVNMGLDGGASFRTKDGKELKAAYENDWDNPLTSFVVGSLNPLGTIMSGGKGRGLTAQLANAIVNTSTSADDAYNKVLEVYQKAGLDFKTAMGIVEGLHKEGRLDDARALADQVSLDMTFNNASKTKAVNIPYGQDRPLSQGVGAATPQTGTSANPAAPVPTPTPPAPVQSPTTPAQPTQAWRR